MTRVLLLRHGATHLTKTLLYGRTPGIPLSDLGREQAALLGHRLTRLDALYTSPIQRAQETAAVIAQIHHLTPRIIDDFAEFDFGDWTNRAFEELSTAPDWQHFNEHRETARPPGGESMPEVQRRAVAALTPLIANHAQGRIAIVSHGDVIRSLLLYATGSAIPNYWRFTIDTASISAIESGSDGATTDYLRLNRANDCAHLERLQPELL